MCQTPCHARMNACRCRACRTWLRASRGSSCSSAASSTSCHSASRYATSGAGAAAAMVLVHSRAATALYTPCGTPPRAHTKADRAEQAASRAGGFDLPKMVAWWPVQLGSSGDAPSAPLHCFRTSRRRRVTACNAVVWLGALPQLAGVLSANYQVRSSDDDVPAGRARCGCAPPGGQGSLPTQSRQGRPLVQPRHHMQSPAPLERSSAEAGLQLGCHHHVWLGVL